MREQAIDISALAEELLRVDGLFDRRDERVALELYSLLGEGEPVSAERLAERTGRSVSEVVDWLRGAIVELDERGDVVAYHGVSLRPTEIAVEVNGQTLYAWCAADALYIPALLGLPARVRSTDPISGQAMSFAVDDGRLREAEPSTAVLSMIRPDDMSSMLAPDDATGTMSCPPCAGRSPSSPPKRRATRSPTPSDSRLPSCSPSRKTRARPADHLSGVRPGTRRRRSLIPRPKELRSR